ncbi:hypothetical protein F0U60_21985 [Archangium minus]|uniref:Transposase n=1 Tax=Archangium minus TaxID=83450 RepID=A0ABY9WRT0_9BACT|nr:hypothetical protein F0U60_21985 [Archangium minus]
MEKQTAGRQQLVRSRVGVDRWEEAPPSVEAARPGQCPRCGAASRPVGAGLVLQGHGTRSRQVRGPAQPGQQAQVRVVQVRRYRCRACGGTCTVVPWEVTWRRLYSVAAMVWALALWGLVGLGLEAVRRLVNPWKHTGASEAGRWRTPLRWLRAVHQGQLLAQVHAMRPWPPHWHPRKAAAHVASVVAGYAPPAAPSPPLSTQAFLGAARAQ